MCKGVERKDLRSAVVAVRGFFWVLNLKKKEDRNLLVKLNHSLHYSHSLILLSPRT
jgi:hypothetical protein